MSQRFACFRVHGFSAGGDIMYLICYVTSHDHFISEGRRIYWWELLVLSHFSDKFVSGGIVRWRYVLNLSRDLA